MRPLARPACTTCACTSWHERTCPILTGCSPATLSDPSAQRGIRYLEARSVHRVRACSASADPTRRRHRHHRGHPRVDRRCTITTLRRGPAIGGDARGLQQLDRFRRRPNRWRCGQLDRGSRWFRGRRCRRRGAAGHRFGDPPLEGTGSIPTSPLPRVRTGSWPATSALLSSLEGLARPLVKVCGARTAGRNLSARRSTLSLPAPPTAMPLAPYMKWAYRDDAPAPVGMCFRMLATRLEALRVIGSRPSSWLWFQFIFESGAPRWRASRCRTPQAPVAGRSVTVRTCRGRAVVLDAASRVEQVAVPGDRGERPSQNGVVAVAEEADSFARHRRSR